MAEVSKTAKKAMQAGENIGKKEKATLSNEEMIRQIRISRPPNANLFVGNMLFVDALLTEYDKLVAENKEFKTANTVINEANRTNAEYIKKLESQVESLRATVLTSEPGQQEHSEILREITS